MFLKRNGHKKYGLVGGDLSYSHSKHIHELIGKYNYELYQKSSDEFEAFIKQRQFQGLNITNPYKSQVITLCDSVTGFARELDSVNTLYFDEDKLIGTNTDYTGFLYMARRAGVSFEKKRVLILGDGATSRTLTKVALDSEATHVFIASRKKQGGDGAVSYISYDELLPENASLYFSPGAINVIINATPVGTYPNNGASLIDLGNFPSCECVLDVVYNPLMTDLIIQARARKLKYSCGLPMLVGQAVAASRLFSPESFAFSQRSGEAMQTEIERVLSILTGELVNIVLIGMPGCGKSTLGRHLAAALNRPFVDLDTEIEKVAGMSIPDIFGKLGEDHFRSLETDMSARFGKESSQVIATGGGVILRPANMNALQQNGRVFLLERDLTKLSAEGRPLSGDLYTLKKLYKQRYHLYKKYADYIIEDGKSVSEETEIIKHYINSIKL